MISEASLQAVGAAWLTAPWAAAALQFAVDPISELDEGVVPDWPDWAPLDAALRVPAIRLRLGRFLLNDPPGTVAAVLAAALQKRQRLLLISPTDAVSLMGFAAAWLHMPRLQGLLRHSDVAAARAALGEEAFAFGFRGARLLPRPSTALNDALARISGPGSTEADWRAAGELLFALAVGEVADGVKARLQLRRPAAVWSRVGSACCDDPAGLAAFAILERLIREVAPEWSSWLR